MKNNKKPQSFCDIHELAIIYLHLHQVTLIGQTLPGCSNCIMQYPGGGFSICRRNCPTPKFQPGR